MGLGLACTGLATILKDHTHCWATALQAVVWTNTKVPGSSTGI